MPENGYGNGLKVIRPGSHLPALRESVPINIQEKEPCSMVSGAEERLQAKVVSRHENFLAGAPRYFRKMMEST